MPMGMPRSSDVFYSRNERGLAFAAAPKLLRHALKKFRAAGERRPEGRHFNRVEGAPLLVHDIMDH